MQPIDPEFESRIRESFAKQGAMSTLGATLERVEAGRIEIRMPFSANFVQHNGYIHAGFLTTIVDSAAGYAAYTVAPPGTNVLTVEYKANFLAPGKGDWFLARGEVVKAGRTLVIAKGDVYAHRAGAEPVHVVTLTSTIMILPGKAGN